MFSSRRIGKMQFPIISDVEQKKLTAGARKRRITHIIIHHSATLQGSAEAFDRYHREIRGWRDAVEKAYDAVFRNIRDKLQELYLETTAARFRPFSGELDSA
jgi:hypothetical protein